MIFINRQVLGASIDLTRASENNSGCWIHVSALFEQAELGGSVDGQIGLGIPHGIHVACLSGQVENHLLVLQQHFHREAVADVGEIHVHGLFKAVDIEQIATVVGNEAID